MGIIMSRWAQTDGEKRNNALRKNFMSQKQELRYFVQPESQRMKSEKKGKNTNF